MTNIATIVIQRIANPMRPIKASWTSCDNPCIASTIFANPLKGLNNGMLLFNLEAYLTKKV